MSTMIQYVLYLAILVVLAIPLGAFPKSPLYFFMKRIRFVRDWNGLWYMAIPLSRY